MVCAAPNPIRLPTEPWNLIARISPACSSSNPPGGLEAERSQAQLAQRAVSVLDALPDFIGIADPDGRVVYVNRAGRAMVGACNSDDLRGCRIHELFPDWSVAEFVSATQPADEFKWNESARVRRRGGDEVRMRQAVFAHVAPGAAVDYFTIITRPRPSSEPRSTEVTDTV